MDCHGNSRTRFGKHGIQQPDEKRCASKAQHQHDFDGVALKSVALLSNKEGKPNWQKDLHKHSHAYVDFGHHLTDLSAFLGVDSELRFPGPEF
ncbi:MAG: hypothetical protein AAGK34_09415 [Planctomycetota bacterium]